MPVEREPANGSPRPAEVVHQLYEVPPPVGAAYRRRVAALVVGIVGVMAALWLRLAYLQVVRGADYRRQAGDLIRKEQLLPTHRGAIRARGGEELAVDEPTFDVALAYPALTSDRAWLRRQARLRHVSEEEILARLDQTWRGLAQVTAADEHDLRLAAGDVIARVQRVKEAVRQGAGRAVTIREETLAHPLLHDVDLALVEQVLERSDEWVGVEVQVESRRRYPLGPTAAHVVGYMLRIRDWQWRQYHQAYGGDERRAYRMDEMIGASGIEAGMNLNLRGRRGWARYLVNARGDVQETLERIEPEPGADVHLTIDLAFQRAVEAALAQACAAHQTTGAAVVMAVDSGEVLAAASYPAFLPGDVRRDYAALAADPAKPLLNRVTAAQYPLGSVFKVVDSIAALECGAITPETHFVCEKRFPVGQRLFHCEGHHGEIDFIPAMAKSCNIYFYQVALATGQSHLIAWAYRLGFGRATGIELPGEIDGILPPIDRFRGSTCNLAIGQGRLSVTPLQAATMMARVANGGYAVKPTILLDGAPRPAPRLPVSQATLDAVRRGLREVVVSGTARRIGFDAVMPTAGKTGTAQVGIAGREPHAWFAGYAPAEQPEIAFAVLIENGGHGGDVAAPVARDILSAYANTRPLLPDGVAVAHADIEDAFGRGPAEGSNR